MLQVILRPEARFSIVPKNFWARKKLRLASSVKLVFSYAVNITKIKITAKFHGSRRVRFGDKNKIMEPEMRPKRFGSFDVPANFWGPKTQLSNLNLLGLKSWYLSMILM